MQLHPPSSPPSTAAGKRSIAVRGVCKTYGETAALSDVSLDIGDNEFFTLLGPSGCGKTTLLRILAGFEEADRGEILLFGDNIERLPPYQRPINTVFQHYALFPHMTVLGNVMFGLRMLRMPQQQAEKRAKDMLKLTRLDEFSGRLPTQLSGGQQQRVALARALAPSPKVLLLDESLSALDLKLRQAMRVELKQIQQDTGITFLFVTHDQDEALTMSDRIAVMSRGTVQQVGDPRDIYEMPVNRFVADFIGEVNLLPVSFEKGADGSICVLQGGHRIAVGQNADSEAAFVSIRPEKARLVAEGGLRGVVARHIYIGAVTETHVRLRDGPMFTVRGQNAAAEREWKIGGEVGVLIDEGAARPLPA